MDIGGKKMDWVEKYRAAKKPILAYMTLLHLAVAAEQTHTIQFLMNDGRKFWENSSKYDHNL